jgi:hypothetical protein
MTSGERYGTESAIVVAAILHLQEGTSTVV